MIIRILVIVLFATPVLVQAAPILLYCENQKLERAKELYYELDIYARTMYQRMYRGRPELYDEEYRIKETNENRISFDFFRQDKYMPGYFAHLDPNTLVLKIGRTPPNPNGYTEIKWQCEVIPEIQSGIKEEAGNSSISLKPLEGEDAKRFADAYAHELDDEMKALARAVDAANFDFDYMVLYASKPLDEPMYLPSLIGDLRRSEITDNEKNYPGLGLTIEYDNANAEGTLYIYDKQLSTIPDGPESPTLHNEFRSIVEAIATLKEKGIYDQVRQTSGAYYSGSPTRGFEFLCGDFEMVLRGIRANSMSCVSGHKDHFIKIRISSPKDNYKLQEFVDSVAAILRLDE